MKTAASAPATSAASPNAPEPGRMATSRARKTPPLATRTMTRRSKVGRVDVPRSADACPQVSFFLLSAALTGPSLLPSYALYSTPVSPVLFRNVTDLLPIPSLDAYGIPEAQFTVRRKERLESQRRRRKLEC